MPSAGSLAKASRMTGLAAAMDSHLLICKLGEYGSDLGTSYYIIS
jgi:hypothetical protein